MEARCIVHYRKEGGARKLLAKEKDCCRQGHFPMRIKTRGLLPSGRRERAHVADPLSLIRRFPVR